MASRRRAGLRSAPHRVESATDNKACWWWYEERGRIMIVHWICKKGVNRTEIATIRSASLSGYLDRLRNEREDSADA